eukprot:m.32282 g.32282  ORF g.32282 m.32282 type:complete len:521 (+) comp8394_c0_seq2:357-1919(+)
MTKFWLDRHVLLLFLSLTSIGQQASINQNEANSQQPKNSRTRRVETANHVAGLSDSLPDYDEEDIVELKEDDVGLATVPRCAEAIANSSHEVSVARFLNPFRRLSEGLENKRLKREYCLWQCGVMSCCQGGFRNEEHFLLVRDTTSIRKEDVLNTVTLVTQGTIDRIPMFTRQAANWPGPKVVVFGIYNHTPSAWRQSSIQLEELRRASSSWRNTRVMVQCIYLVETYIVHFLKKALLITHLSLTRMDKYSKKMEDPKLTLYPINAIRNFVVDEAKTNWVFPLDIDFIPSETLYRRLPLYLSRFQKLDRIAVVVPHFEVTGHSSLNDSVSDFQSLKSNLLAGGVVPFHSQVSLLIPDLKTADSTYNRSWPQGVAASNYARWLRESEYNLFGFFPCESGWNPYTYHLQYWEPFVMVRRVEADESKLPRYNEAYVGRYRNKVAFVSNLRAKKYAFHTLLQEFAIHYPHDLALGNSSTTDVRTLKKLMTLVDDTQKAELARGFRKITNRRIKATNSKGWHCRN